MICIIEHTTLESVCKYRNSRFSDDQVENICMMREVNTPCSIDTCPLVSKLHQET